MLHIQPLCALVAFFQAIIAITTRLYRLSLAQGIYLHGERTGNLTRRDGTVPKPTLLERYFNRPLESFFDDIDIITYHSTFGTARSPPQYATEVWMEDEWEDDTNRLLVFRKRSTTTVSYTHLVLHKDTVHHQWNNTLDACAASTTIQETSIDSNNLIISIYRRLPKYSSWVPLPSTNANCSTCGCF